jgi:hypothetical protein
LSDKGLLIMELISKNREEYMAFILSWFSSLIGDNTISYVEGKSHNKIVFSKYF